MEKVATFVAVVCTALEESIKEKDWIDNSINHFRLFVKTLPDKINFF